VFHSLSLPGGLCPPGRSDGPPRGQLSKKFLCRCCPTKPPRGDALGPAGENFPGGPNAGRTLHPSVTLERAVGKLSGKESWKIAEMSKKKKKGRQKIRHRRFICAPPESPRSPPGVTTLNETLDQRHPTRRLVIVSVLCSRLA
jgi:hypothetical protein